MINAFSVSFTDADSGEIRSVGAPESTPAPVPTEPVDGNRSVLAPGTAQDVEAAQAQRAALLADREFGAKYVAGDAAAREQMLKLDTIIAADQAAAESQALPFALPSEREAHAAEVAAAFGPPASPLDYDLPSIPGLDDPRANIALRSMLHAAELDKASAAYFVSEYLREVEGRPPPTDAELELGKANARVALEKLWGEQTDSKIADARAEMQRIARGHPVILEILGETVLGNSPMLIQRLALNTQLRRERGR